MGTRLSLSLVAASEFPFEAIYWPGIAVAPRRITILQSAMRNGLIRTDIGWVEHSFLYGVLAEANIKRLYATYQSLNTERLQTRKEFGWTE